MDQPETPKTSATMQAKSPSSELPAQECDVLVIGGGPAGSTVAPLLHALGHRVVLLEKSHHPRFHIGESLLPANLPLFRKLGVAEEIEAIGMPKHAAEFISPWHENSQEYRFAEGWNKALPNAYQVERARFDHVLIENARRKGVEVIEGCEVLSVDLERPDGGAEIRAKTEDGQARTWRARFVADASGRDTFLSSRLQWKVRSKVHNSVAVYAHYRGAVRREGRGEGDITLFWFDYGWFWFIPLVGGVTSVGMVTWPHFLKTRGGMSIEEFLRKGIDSCAPLAARLQEAQMVTKAVATGNFSYSSRRCHGRNFVLLGDAFAFVDPVFSSGVWLAMHSGDHAAGTIDTCLRHPEAAPAALREFDRMMRHGPREFSWFIHRITNPTLRDMFMHPTDKMRLKEAVLSLLAGDIFEGTPIWRTILLLKLAYYVVAVRNFGRTIGDWFQRRRNIRREAAVESNVTSA